MQRYVRLLSILLGLLLSANLVILPARPAAAKDSWTSIRSRHFFLVGNASEREIRKVATRLEQFRAAFSRLFSKANLNSRVPTTVIVFKNLNSYRPFMPTYQGKTSEVVGYFQPGEDVNYITLTAELQGANPYGTIFHEYVHSLTNDNASIAPPWFSEGLAEFYSTFEVSEGDKKVTLGKPIANHVFLLREKKFLPLHTLFAVDHSSPHYNERDKKGVFYAQSWALMHYLTLGNKGQRQPQLEQYLKLLSAGKPIGESFQQAFQTDYATMEKELRDYINRDTYTVTHFTFSERLEFDTQMQSAPVSEAEAQYYLGDLLRHLNRSEAEEYLQRALALDPNLAAAHASLGIARMRQQCFDEAKQHLERAVTADSRNHLAHYYYAFVLSRESASGNTITGFPEGVVPLMRFHLKKAIELAPSFPESYHLLAFINLVTGQQLDESIELLKRALTLAPSKHELTLMLAQIYLRKQEPETARRLVEPIARNSADRQIRAQAQSLLETITRLAEQMVHFKAERSSVTGDPLTGAERRTVIQAGQPTLRRRFEGEKVRGLLTRIECLDDGLTLVIKAGDRTLTLHSTAPERIQFVTYSQEGGEVLNCGPRDPGVPVLVTYRTSTDARSKFDGEPIAVEFVKPE